MEATKVIQAVRRELQDPRGANWKDAELLRYINTAIRTFALQIENLWPDTMVSTNLYGKDVHDLQVNKEYYNLPSDFWRVLEVFVNGYRVHSLSIKDWEEGVDGYILESGQLRIPSPDEFYEDGLEIYYLEEPTRLEAVTQEVPMGDDWFDPLVEGVKLQAKGRDQENVQVQQQLLQVLNNELQFQANQENTGELRLTPPNDNWI